MTRMIVLALVAAVAIQACSARVLLEDAPNVQAVAQQLSALTTQAAETVIGGPMFFVSHVDLYYRVWKVEAAVKYEKTHFDYYGDPEAVAQESLAGIGTDVTVRKEEAVGIIEAANATIYDTVAQAAAGVKDDEVLALLHTIRQTYSGASQAILTEAVKYAQDCGIVARDGLGNHRPVEDTHTVVLAKLSALYSISEEAIHSAVSNANKVVQDALAGN